MPSWFAKLLEFPQAFPPNDSRLQQYYNIFSKILQCILKKM
jgi:hypothetical protein